MFPQGMPYQGMSPHANPFGDQPMPGGQGDDAGADDDVSPLLAALAGNMAMPGGQGQQPSIEDILTMLAMQQGGSPPQAMPPMGQADPGITMGIPRGGASYC